MSRNLSDNCGFCTFNSKFFNRRSRNVGKITEPLFFMDGQSRRIVHQVWDWVDKRRYILHLYITQENQNGWQSHHFTGRYRAVTLNEMTELIKKAGFKEVKILNPNNSKYFQPLIVGKMSDLSG